jgi:hypothetical protein
MKDATAGNRLQQQEIDMELSAAATRTLHHRFETCRFLGQALGIEKGAEHTCHELPCFHACPLQKMEALPYEQRRCKRKAVNIAIRYGIRLEHYGVAENVSIGGMGIEGAFAPFPGEKILVSLCEHPTCVAEATVVWVHEEADGVNMGVKFQRMTKELKAYLTKILTASAV